MLSKEFGQASEAFCGELMRDVRLAIAYLGASQLQYLPGTMRMGNRYRFVSRAMRNVKRFALQGSGLNQRLTTLREKASQAS